MVEQILEFNDNMQATHEKFFDDTNDNELSHHHKVPSSINDLDWDDITQLIHDMDAKPGMSFNARQMARQHKQKILSMRRNLTKKKLIMRASYKGYSFHTYPAKQFQQKASNYIEKTGIYTLINRINPSDPKMSHQCLFEMIEQVDTTLKHLLDSKSITDAQYILMHPQRSMIRLNYLHFVPDRTKEDQPLQPIIICENGPTWNIMTYLSSILWSMFNQMTGCQTFSNESDDIVYAMEQYMKHGYLHETTQFVTFNINDICTKFSHALAIKALETFLNSIHLSSAVETTTNNICQGLTNETIIQLVRLVLANQFFIYDNKLYQQTYGGASGSLLTIPLACIYLFYGQSSSLSFIDTLINNKHEIFGRCRDDFFFTCNDSKDHMQTCLNEIMIKEQQQRRIPIEFMSTIGTTIHLFDLQLGHDRNVHRSHGFFTKIDRDPTTDDFELPNRFQYHTYQPSSLFKAALQHAVQCCSNENDFHNERRHLRITYLRRGFSSSFIDKYTNEFFNEFNVKTRTCFGSCLMIPYQTLRQHVLDNYEQRKIATLKKEAEQQQDEKQTIIRVPYPSDWNIQMATNIKDDLLNIIKDSFQDQQVFNNIKYELVPCPQTPLTINDYLVDKRPPLRLLTLPTSSSSSSLDNED